MHLGLTWRDIELTRGVHLVVHVWTYVRLFVRVYGRVVISFGHVVRQSKTFSDACNVISG